MVGKVWQFQYGDFCPTDSWAPPVNVYHLSERIEIAVDLAGIDRSNLDVRIEPRRLTIAGVRQPPEPDRPDNERMRIAAMEIDHGSFCRMIPLPDAVDLPRAKSEYVDGILWIHLPLRADG